jgi:glycosyltransferase involved in cell wall biosynthesis
MFRVARIQSRICIGGPAFHSILLSEGLDRRLGSPYRTRLYGGELDPGEVSMAPFAEERGVQFELLPGMGRSIRLTADFRVMQDLARRFSNYRPHIVHTHTAKAGAVGRLAAVRARVPVLVHTFHGHVFEGYFHPAVARGFLELERALAQQTDCIVAISEGQKRELVDRYRVAPEGKVRVIPLGLDLDTMLASKGTSGEIRSFFGIPQDAPLVMTAGRFASIKRLDLLLEAFGGLLSQQPEAHLLLVGDGDPDSRSRLENQASRYPGRVHFAGWQRALLPYYQDADLFVLSSDNEGTPVALIEALSAGLPSVVTDVGGVRDVMTDPVLGRLVPRRDVSALVEAMSQSLAVRSRLPDPLRQGIGARFSHHRLVSDVSSLYDELLEGYRRGVLSKGRRQRVQE